MTFTEYLTKTSIYTPYATAEFKAMSESHKMLYQRGSYLFDEGDYESEEEAFENGDIMTGYPDEFAIKFYSMCELYSIKEAEEWLIEAEYEEPKNEAVA